MNFEEWWNTYHNKCESHYNNCKDAWEKATCNANLQVEQLEGEVENYVTIISRLEDKLAVVNSKLTPEGYVIVPVEPTEKMFKAGLGWRESDSELEGEYRMVYESYKAMIQAAQEEE